MLSLTLAQVRAHVARLVASTLAIVIAVGFVVATLVVNETLRSTVLTAAGSQYLQTAAVVTSGDGSSLDDEAAVAAALPGVRAVAPQLTTGLQAVVPGGNGPRYLQAEAVAADPALRWQRLTAGTLPDRPGQVAVSGQVDAQVGDVLPVTTYPDDGEALAGSVTVVGVVDLSADPGAGLYGRAFATAEQLRAWGAPAPTELLVAGAGGVAASAVRAEVSAALAGRPAVVRTGEEQAELAAARLLGGATALTGVLLAFGTVAVLVAGLVIANTFAVLLAQRTRELALLRCVGATARQVRRGVLLEALATGLVASALGVLAGVALAAGTSALAGSDSAVPLSALAVPGSAPVVGLLVGTLVTVLAALAPARAATRVAPLAAHRPADPDPVRSRPGLLRLALGLLLIVPGAGLMGLGVSGPDILLALAGGSLSFLGVVLLGQRIVPPVVAATGLLLARLGGVPAGLAAGNASRSPRRTAATATALLIGVTLTTSMVVGAASTRATASAGLDAQYPVDVVVQTGPVDRVPAGLLGQLLALEGVTAGSGVTIAELTGPDGQPVRVQGVDAADAGPVLRSEADLDLPAEGQVVLPQPLADAFGLGPGDPATFRSEGRSLTLSVIVGQESGPPRLDAGDLSTLVPQPQVAELWLRLSDDDSPAAVVDEMNDLIGAAAPEAQVTGLVSERATLDALVSTLLLVVTGLLGVAVVIALIGVGNTLALSVVERRQEIGLLRAIGLTRRQLRAVLGWEAVTVAGVAAVLGVLLGILYGLVGAASLVGEVGEVVLSVPVGEVAAIVGVAAAAGLLASVLPGRRAARTPPVAAIAG